MQLLVNIMPDVTWPQSADHHVIVHKPVDCLTGCCMQSFDLVTYKMVGDTKFYGAYEYQKIQIH
jgi:hypothetical protein